MCLTEKLTIPCGQGLAFCPSGLPQGSSYWELSRHPTNTGRLAKSSLPLPPLCTPVLLLALHPGLPASLPPLPDWLTCPPSPLLAQALHGLWFCGVDGVAPEGQPHRQHQQGGRGPWLGNGYHGLKGSSPGLPSPFSQWPGTPGNSLVRKGLLAYQMTQHRHCLGSWSAWRPATPKGSAVGGGQVPWDGGEVSSPGDQNQGMSGPGPHSPGYLGQARVPKGPTRLGGP